MEGTMHAPGSTMRMLCALAALATLLGGCGGSGSSGFDPSFGEGLLIEQAIEERRCVEYQMLTICPSGATAPTAPHGAPSTPEVRVEASVERADLIDCGLRGGGCRLLVTLSADGLAPGAEVRLAARLVPDGAWQVGPALALPAPDGTGAAVVPATLEVRPTDAAVDGVQVAALVFATPAGAVPAAVEELADTGAAWAFVLPVLEPAS
jgi:hypothetical protein